MDRRPSVRKELAGLWDKVRYLKQNICGGGGLHCILCYAVSVYVAAICQANLRHYTLCVYR